MRRQVCACVVVLCALFLAAAPVKRLRTSEDLDRELRIVFDDGHEVRSIVVENRWEIRLEDKNHDGKPDAFELVDRGTRKVRRWYGSTQGPQNGGTFFLSDGTEETISWGSYREEEAERNRRKMDEELQAPKQ